MKEILKYADIKCRICYKLISTEHESRTNNNFAVITYQQRIPELRKDLTFIYISMVLKNTWMSHSQVFKNNSPAITGVPTYVP